jgi:hypothetical protein
MQTYTLPTTGLAVNLPRTESPSRLEHAIPLAIEKAAQPNKEFEPIPHKPMIVKDK